MGKDGNAKIFTCIKKDLKSGKDLIEVISTRPKFKHCSNDRLAPMALLSVSMQGWKGPC